MKLRVRGNFLRLRLHRLEIAALDLGDTIEERTEFGPAPENSLVWSVAARTQDAPLAAEFAANRISVFIRREEIAALANTENVGVECAQEIEGDRSLRLLLEKDFVCLQDRYGEDDSHNFENPSACSA